MLLFFVDFNLKEIDHETSYPLTFHVLRNISDCLYGVSCVLISYYVQWYVVVGSSEVD